MRPTEKDMKEVTWREIRNTYTIFDGNRKEKRSIFKPKCRWKYNIKINFLQMLCDSMEWFQTQVYETDLVDGRS